jgi:hypothetical protein
MTSRGFARIDADRFPRVSAQYARNTKTTDKKKSAFICVYLRLFIVSIRQGITEMTGADKRRKTRISSSGLRPYSRMKR